MTDGAAFQPGQGELPSRPRSAYVGHEAFGHGDGAVLVDPEVARDLRSAAELARQERRITGGLLYGRSWTDEAGRYLVVDGFLEAGPGENKDDRIHRDGGDQFALSAADLHLLREDADRMYTAALEVGWWRTLPGSGEFGPRDFVSQLELVPPGGVGLLVFGSGLEWGTAYLGPDGLRPGSARSFIPVPRPAAEAPPPRELIESEPLAAQQAEPVPAGAGSPATEGTRRQPALTPPPQPAGQRVVSPVGVPSRDWGSVKRTARDLPGPRTPTDVKVVVGALIAVAIVAAGIIGLLVSNVLVAVILGMVGLIAVAVFLWWSRL